MKPLLSYHPCLNLTVERHVEVVTEASTQIAGFERRDEITRQKPHFLRLQKIIFSLRPSVYKLLKNIWKPG